MGTAPISPDVIAAYFDRLWPLLRSITGEGVRQTHDILSELLPLERIEIPSGTKVFDWTVPKEWVVREAYVVCPDGRKILDVSTNNLHLLNYSVPFRGCVPRAELGRHLYSLPELPAAIPYVTSYYDQRWGFCLPHAELESLPEGDYQVHIDTAHINGSLTLSEALLPGWGTGEVLISVNTCHPSLANNELSGPLIAAFLYQRLSSLKRRRLSYRFVFAPETIGSLCYLNLRGEYLNGRIVGGYVIQCSGTDGHFIYKKSRQGDSQADRAAFHVLSVRKGGGKESEFQEFSPVDGGDERQYCSPGFNFPVGCLMRSACGAYPEYHTSLDNRSFISFEAISESIETYFDILCTVDLNVTYQRSMPYGEPQLGVRGLYPTLGTRGALQQNQELSALLWVLNYADGRHDLLDIVQLSGLDLIEVSQAAEKCLEAKLLEVAQFPKDDSRSSKEGTEVRA